jgi:hypothetical protein
MYVVKTIASLKLGEDAAERAGVELVFGQRLVHALGAPTDAAGVEWLIWDHG